MTMGQIPKQLQPARSVLHYFGAEVRRLRQALGMSQAELGMQVFAHRDLIRKVESAERLPSDELVGLCDQALGADGTLRQLLPMLHRERQLRLSAATGNPAAGFRSSATDRPVLDWLVFSTRNAHAARVDDHTAGAADRLRHLRRSSPMTTALSRPNASGGRCCSSTVTATRSRR